MKRNKLFNYEELKRMNKLKKRGYSYRDLGKLYHIHHTTILKHLRKYKNIFSRAKLLFEYLFRSYY